MPTEGLPFILNGFDIHHIANLATDLQVVIIQDDHQIIQFIMRSSHGGFPNLTFLTFSISNDGIHSARAVIQLPG